MLWVYTDCQSGRPLLSRVTWALLKLLVNYGSTHDIHEGGPKSKPQVVKNSKLCKIWTTYKAKCIVTHSPNHYHQFVILIITKSATFTTKIW